MRHHLFGRSLFWLVCCSGLAGPLAAQESAPGGPTAAPMEPAPNGTPPTGSAATRGAAPTSAPAPEPGSALAALLGSSTAVEPQHPAVVVAAAEEGPVPSGFAVGASLGVDLAVGAGATSPQPSLQPGIALGGKFGRLVVSLGAEFSNLSVSSKVILRSGPTSSISQSVSNFVVVPGVQVGILHSRDGRVELLGAARLGVGAPTNSTSQDPAVPVTASTFSTRRVSFMYELGTGVRYWAHRHFALNLLAGFRGDYLFQSTSGNFPQDTSVTMVTANATSGTNGIFASIGGLGVF